MAKFSFSLAVLLFLLLLTIVVLAQSGPTGTWRVEGNGSPLPWEAVLKAEGPHLVGAVSLGSLNNAAEISDGTVEGNTISFNHRNGQRTITLTGTLNGDEITFSWKSQDQNASSLPPNDALFGALAPPRFTAKRVPGTANAVSDLAARVRKPPTVTFDRLLRAFQEPQNWLTYSGNLSGARYSPLTQIDSTNIDKLELAWIWQARFPQGFPRFEATSLVVDGILYTVQPPNDVVALDAQTGRLVWTYSYSPTDFGPRRNRGLAILGGTLFLGTLDAHLIAIDAYSGKLKWNTTVANSADPVCNGSQCYAFTLAPLVVKDKVIVGPAGGEGRIRGFIAAFDAATGKEVWRFWTIPGPGEPGNETWSGDSWMTGGGSVWNTGTYDPDLNLTYWGIGNPAPNDNPNARLGDNLYTESVVALDADTGQLKWHYQFTPHDDMDWDSTQIPVLADISLQGKLRKVMLFANRNGLMYVLDRTTGEFLMGKPFVEVNWMTGFDAKGNPIRAARSANTPVRPGPGEGGATNWYPPSYSLKTGLFYVPAWEFPANPRFAEIRAIDPLTAESKWEFKREGVIFKSGVLTTASDLLFTGAFAQNARNLLGDFYALDARTGQLLWRRTLPGQIQSAPMSYSVDGKQFVAIVAGDAVYAYALRQQ